MELEKIKTTPEVFIMMHIYHHMQEVCISSKSIPDNDRYMRGMEMQWRIKGTHYPLLEEKTIFTRDNKSWTKKILSNDFFLYIPVIGAGEIPYELIETDKAVFESIRDSHEIDLYIIEHTKQDYIKETTGLWRIKGIQFPVIFQKTTINDDPDIMLGNDEIQIQYFLCVPKLKGAKNEKNNVNANGDVVQFCGPQ